MLVFFLCIQFFAFTEEIDLTLYEKSVYSQNGEDGIVAKIFREIEPVCKVSLELLGERKMRRSNTYLLKIQGWRALLMNEVIHNPEFDLYRECVTEKNINELFDQYLIPYHFDLLSIDLADNQLKVWKALDEKYTPTVVLISYQSLQGPFSENDESGANISALYKLGKSKGYSLVYAENSGKNLIFIRDDVLQAKNLVFKDMNNPFRLYRYPMYDKSEEYCNDLNDCKTWTVSKLSPELISLSEYERKLQKYLDEFPFDQYKIFEVNDLGEFYVDDLPDSIKSHIRKGIYWESEIGNLVKKFAFPGTLAIDIGAHMGIHTLAMSRKVGVKGFVVSFEPQYKLFRELSYNLNLNNINNVFLIRSALGEKLGLIEMSVRNSENEGGTSIGKGGDSAYMFTLDSLNLDPVSLIKIDVESYELNVLRGAEETIKRNRPTIILEILGNYDLNHCSDELKMQCETTIDFLRTLEYDVYRIYGNDFIALSRTDL